MAVQCRYMTQREANQQGARWALATLSGGFGFTDEIDFELDGVERSEEDKQRMRAAFDRVWRKLRQMAGEE